MLYCNKSQQSQLHAETCCIAALGTNTDGPVAMLRIFKLLGISVDWGLPPRLPATGPPLSTKTSTLPVVVGNIPLVPLGTGTCNGVV